MVDDERAMTRILRSMLELDGYVVDEAWSGIGVVDRVRDDPPDLVMLDVHLPGMTGLEVLARLCDGGRAPLPVIMLTGEGETAAQAVESLRAGAVDYLVKPVAMDRLLQSARAALSQHRRSREVELLSARLQAERAGLAALLGALDEGVALVDDQLVVRALNRPAARLLGCDPDGAVGATLADLLVPGTVGDVRQLLDHTAGASVLVRTRRLDEVEVGAGRVVVDGLRVLFLRPVRVGCGASVECPA